MTENFTKKELIAIILIVVCILVAIGVKFLPKTIVGPKSNPRDENNFLGPIDPVDNEMKVEKTGASEEVIMVHISGQVYKSGLIELKLGQRLIDAVELAGGLKDGADLDRINLAKKLSDEDKIYIPAVGEEDIIGSIFEENTSQGGKININKCDKSQLLGLPGIGDVIATRIIEYREKTPFASVEDLLNVSGIGEKKYGEIKDLIIVN